MTGRTSPAGPGRRRARGPAVLARLLDLARLLNALSPGGGWRRRAAWPERAHEPRTASGLRLVRRPWGPPYVPVRHGPRGAGFDWGPVIDADSQPLVRPYLVAYEQQQRRRALELALDGIDVGPCVIHGVPVGARVCA